MGQVIVCGAAMKGSNPKYMGEESADRTPRGPPGNLWGESGENGHR